jgi:glycosyltransferase involved in cell wall biosynthesis
MRVDLNRGLSSPPRLIYAGRLSVEKGVPNLIRAIALLREQGFQPMPHCTLAGDGPQRPEIETLVRELNCEEQVTLTGQLERPALSELLSRADLCVHPSSTEGYCKAWLDAMAHGLPVLTTEVGAARAVVGGSGVRGWLVPPGDAVAFAAALREVLSGTVSWAPLRQRCRDFAAARTLERWAGVIGAACVQQWGTPLNGRKEPS